MFRFLIGSVILSVAPWNASVSAAEPQTVHVYFIGNSVTDTIRYDGLESLAASRGHKHVWGRHMIPGAPLQWIWEHADDGFQKPPFGHYPRALQEFTWDAVCLQPFDQHMDGDVGDVAMAKNFISMALEKSPDVQIYVYARWPRKEKDGSLDYESRWTREYTARWDQSNETKDYFQRLVEAIRTACPELKKPVLLVPVGHVMYELDQRLKAESVGGITSIGDVYKDHIHLNQVGSYLVACTFFATLYGESPQGLATEPYGQIDPELAELIHRVVWDVVTSHELSGISVKPNPKSPSSSAPAKVPTVRKKKRSNTIPSREMLRPESRDDRYRRMVIGTWQDEYQGKRTMTLNKDGTGTMLVELSGIKATLFASRLRFDMEWSVANGRLKKRTIGGEPKMRVNMILKSMGDRVDEPILNLTKDQLLLLDKDGETRYDWRRKK